MTTSSRTTQPKSANPIVGWDKTTEEGASRDARLVDGLSFALGTAGEISSIWGRGEEILWAGGEPVLLAGPDGVGKTTLAQQLALARIGVGSELLGFPVAATEGKLLYVAADRPKQAARSLWRMVKDLVGSEHAKIRERLLVWQGPLPFNIVAEPARLTAWARSHDATDVMLDSLGHVATGLSNDDVGSAIAQAFNGAMADGLELFVNYHPRKAGRENPKPNKLEDVYGSRWITSACGSVLSLWGSAGDPVVELRHLKQPIGVVGPFDVEHDQYAGELKVAEGSDLLGILRAARNGLSAKDAGAYMDGSSEKAREVKARRKLEAYVSRHLAYRQEGIPIRGSIHEPDRYFATPPEGAQEAFG
jgi:replicative DNA helicase